MKSDSQTETEQSFLAGIAAHPEDDLRRLVFADWLEENGQEARARFIRAHKAKFRPNEVLVGGEWKQSEKSEV